MQRSFHSQIDVLGCITRKLDYYLEPDDLLLELVLEYLRAQERPATLIYTVTSGLRITRARHDYNRDAETGS